MNSPLRLLLLVMLTLAVSCAAQSVRSPRQIGSSDQELHIKVEGSFERAVLTDPKHRVNLITETGVEKTFPGCFRFDMPEQFGIPDSLDYVGFRIYGPLPGRYRIVMRASKANEIGVSAYAQWPGGGTDDGGWGRAAAGDEVICYVRVTMDPKEGAGAFRIKVEGFRARAPRSSH